MTGNFWMDTIESVGEWGLFSLIVLVLIGVAVLAMLFAGLAIRYTIRRLRTYFQDEKARAAL